MLPSDLSLLSSPVTFLTFQARATDGKAHAVTVYFDATGEWVVNEPNQKVVCRRLQEEIAGKKFITMGSAEQPILERSGDNVRIDWGYLYVGAPAGEAGRIVAADHGVREKFAQTGSIPKGDDADMPRLRRQVAESCAPLRGHLDWSRRRNGETYSK
jgi:hypothetical protein